MAQFVSADHMDTTEEQGYHEHDTLDNVINELVRDRIVRSLLRLRRLLQLRQLLHGSCELKPGYDLR